MKAYMIIAEVNGTAYLTKVHAESESSAEHAALDLGICGKHAYGVTGCMAFDEDAMKYDTFIYAALHSTPVGFDDLKKIVEKRNAEIREKDEAEERIYQIEKQMKKLEEELAKAKEILSK